jgi:hypothetical protein
MIVKFQKFFTDKVQRWSTFANIRSLDKTEQTDLKTYAGTYKLSRAQELELYMVNSREMYAATHLSYTDDEGNFHEGAGFVVPQEKGLSLHVKMNFDDWHNMKARLEADKEFMEVVNGFRDIFSSSHDLTANTFEAMNGISLPKAENYYPITIGEASTKLSPHLRFIESFKGLRAATGTNEAIRIGDAFSTLNHYISDTSNYNAFAVPLHNMKTFMRHNAQELNQAGHEKAMTYIEKFVTDLENGRHVASLMQSNIMGIDVQKLINNLSTAAIGLNPWTILKQLPALQLASSQFGQNWKGYRGRAAKVTKDVLKEGFSNWSMPYNNPTIKEIIANSPYLSSRLITTNISHAADLVYSTGGNILKAGTLKNAVKERSGRQAKRWAQHQAMEGVRIADGATIAGIWEASKMYIQDTFPDMKVGSPAYWHAVDNKAMDAMINTQPTYDMVHKTGWQRDQNPLVRVFTLFGSQPAKNLNMLVSSWLNHTANPDLASFSLMKKNWSNVIVFNAMAMAAVDLLRAGAMGDDDDKLALTTVSFLRNNVSNIPLLGTVAEALYSRVDNKPYVRNISSPFEDMMNTALDAAAAATKGQWESAVDRSIRVGMRFHGLPEFPVRWAKNTFLKDTGNQ